MFIRYTHYGIGHPPVLRELTRDCANADPADSRGSEENENDSDGEWESDIRRCHSVHEDEGGEEGDGAEEDEELESGDEDSSVENDLDGDMEVSEDEKEEDDYIISF